jgi:4-hydroxybenzoate polyprenyltransferase
MQAALMSYHKLVSYIRLMRLNKPIGIFLLLWPTLMALWIAGEGRPDLSIVCIFVLGTVIMRSAGCVINDLADCHFDKEVSRTKDRPLVVGIVSKTEAKCLFFFLLLLAFLLDIQLNRFTIILSWIGLLLAIIYPFMKRITYLPQFILGAAFSLATLMAFTALTNEIPCEAILLFSAMLCWTVTYDTQYAMADRLDDLRIGIKSTAILFGQADRGIIFSLQILALLLLVIMGQFIHASSCYYGGVVLALGFVLYQQYLIKDRDADRCFTAFLNNNFLGAVLFLGLAVDYYVK